jgi:hypothetical protein
MSITVFLQGSKESVGSFRVNKGRWSTYDHGDTQSTWHTIASGTEEAKDANIGRDDPNNALIHFQIQRPYQDSDEDGHGEIQFKKKSVTIGEPKGNFFGEAKNFFGFGFGGAFGKPATTTTVVVGSIFPGKAAHANESESPQSGSLGLPPTFSFGPSSESRTTNEPGRSEGSFGISFGPSSENRTMPSTEPNGSQVTLGLPSGGSFGAPRGSPMPREEVVRDEKKIQEVADVLQEFSKNVVEQGHTIDMLVDKSEEIRRPQRTPESGFSTPAPRYKDVGIALGHDSPIKYEKVPAIKADPKRYFEHTVRMVAIEKPENPEKPKFKPVPGTVPSSFIPLAKDLNKM